MAIPETKGAGKLLEKGKQAYFVYVYNERTRNITLKRNIMSKKILVMMLIIISAISFIKQPNLNVMADEKS